MLISENHLTFFNHLKILNYMVYNHPDDIAHSGTAIVININKDTLNTNSLQST